jgi:hypothetical protein
MLETYYQRFSTNDGVLSQGDRPARSLVHPSILPKKVVINELLISMTSKRLPKIPENSEKSRAIGKGRIGQTL